MRRLIRAHCFQRLQLKLWIVGALALVLVPDPKTSAQPEERQQSLGQAQMLPGSGVTRGARTFVVEVQQSDNPLDERPVEKQTYKWERPRNVDYVLLTGCGGGGSGATGGFVGTFGQGGITAGGGGGGAPVRTLLVGPLSASNYEVFVGKGGGVSSINAATRTHVYDVRLVAGKGGEETVFAGDDFSVVFPGGIGGGAGRTSGRHYDETYGGAPGEPGQKGMFQRQQPLVGAFRASALPGGGGGAGTGSGGEGGDKDQNGSPGAGFCSGGGGSGSFGFGTGPQHLTSGAGANGFLTIVPLVNIESIDDEVGRIMQRLENLASFPTGADDGNAQ